MADLPSTQPSAEPLVYRPISGLALAGFVLAALFAGLVALSTLAALIQGLPVFLPGSALGLALVAAVLCFLAQRRIRNSEGTLAGMGLARWGLWLSVLTGVTYFVYTWVTGMALAKQANDFLTGKADEDAGFFAHLQNAAKNRTDLYQAFLLTLPTTNRGGSKAANEEAMLFQFDQPGKDGEPGNISKFRKNQLVMAFLKNADTIKIEPLGIMEWKYENNSYHVLRNYRFTTPELVIENPIPVQSTEGASEGESRRWFVVMNRVVRLNTTRVTPLGEKLMALRFYSKKFLEKWNMDFIQGGSAPEYKEIDTDWTALLPKKEAQRDHVRKMVGEVLRGERKTPTQLMLATDDLFADWSDVKGHIEITHPVRMLLPPADNFAGFNVELDFVIGTTEPVDLSAPRSETSPTWEIRKIRVTRAVLAAKMTLPKR